MAFLKEAKIISLENGMEDAIFNVENDRWRFWRMNFCFFENVIPNSNFKLKIGIHNSNFTFIILKPTLYQNHSQIEIVKTEP